MTERNRGDELEGEVARQLAADHAHLEQLFQSVMAGLRGGDPDLLRARWLELDRALERHLYMEEELILPSYGRQFPAAAARLRHEHHEIRAALVQLGVDLDLHEMSASSATQFIDALRVHSAYEDAVLYPWAQQHLSGPELALLFARLRSRHLPSARGVPTQIDEGQRS